MVLIGGFDRILLSASPRKYTLVEICLRVNKSVVLPPFTGKVAKSLLIIGNHKLYDIFEKPFMIEYGGVKINVPKPLRVTPLYIKNNGGIRYLWKKTIKGSQLKLGGNKLTCFKVGFEEGLEKDIYYAIAGMDGALLFDAQWFIESIRVEESFKLPSKTPNISLDNISGIRVFFRSPVKLVDPWKKTRFGRFLPIAGVLFAYNIGELLRLLKRDIEYWYVVSMVSAALRETHRIWETVRKVTYVYDGRELPALAGYATYIVDDEIINSVRGFKTFLENVIAHAIIMGIGSSRAIGLGHVDILLLSKNNY